jgi:hypothetical protein
MLQRIRLNKYLVQLKLRIIYLTAEGGGLKAEGNPIENSNYSFSLQPSAFCLFVHASKQYV